MLVSDFRKHLTDSKIAGFAHSIRNRPGTCVLSVRATKGGKTSKKGGNTLSKTKMKDETTRLPADDAPSIGNSEARMYSIHCK